MAIDAIMAAIPELTSFGAEAGAATAAAGEGLAAAGEGLTMADIVGTGAGLAGGTTGLEGTLMAGGSGLGLADLAGGTAGLGALGTAADFMGTGGLTGVAGAGTPTATGFGAAADQALQAAQAGGVAPAAVTPAAQPMTFGGVSSNLSPSVANANAGASVFDTGTAPISNAGITGSGATAGTGASSVAAPAGVTGGIDPTAAASGTTGTAAGTGGTAGTTGATAASGAGTSIADTLKSAGSGALKSLTSNPLGVALGAAGLGYNMLQGQKQTPNQQALTAEAAKANANSDQMVASGQALQQYLTNGTLPPAYQAQVDQAIDAAKTTAISNAAAQGLPTDPNKNTALAATLAKIDASRPQMQAQVASQLFSSGSSLVSAGQQSANLSSNLYQALVQNDTTSAANTGKAIANLAAALSGKSGSTGGVSINLGGTPSASVVNPGAGQSQQTA